MKQQINVFMGLFLIPIALFAQNKQMTPEVYDIWNSIESVKISSNGEWVSYELNPGKGDGNMVLYNTQNQTSHYFSRASEAVFDANNKFIAFKISPHQDSIDAKKRLKVKKDEMPKDSLGIYHLYTSVLDKIADIESYKIPEKTGGAIAFKLHKRSSKKDSTLVKKENKKNGTQLMVYNFEQDSIMLFSYVKDYLWSKYNKQLLIHSSGQDSIQNNSIDILDLTSNNSKNILTQKGEFFKFTFNEKGDKLAFIMDKDTSKNIIRPYALCFWNGIDNNLKTIADNNSEWIANDWQLSHTHPIQFSKNNERLYFGTRPIPMQEDTTLLDSEKVELEIWNYKDGQIYTQQNVNLNKEKDRSYLALYKISTQSFTQLSHLDNQNMNANEHLESEYILSYDQQAYEKYITWLGYAFKDVYLTNIKTGKRQKIASRIQGTPRMSPSENYVYWYNSPDTAWVTYDIHNQKLQKITQGSFYDELNDVPRHPSPSGMLSWTENDASVLIYDHYDIWKIDPKAQKLPINLTNGRNDKVRYRYIKLDSEIRQLAPDTSILVKIFDEKNKSSGYAYLDLKKRKQQLISKSKHNYSSRIYKAEDADKLIYTKESFKDFPNLILTNTKFENEKTISKANPQQVEYAWGNIEIFKWKNFEGKTCEGLLVKPADFDPNKKYPLMVNFYERSSDGLHNHRAPYPHRSTINYSYWSNKGYVIFNPDIKYKVGYPGQSCYDAVMSGVESLLKLGFVDKDKMGLQGHSWGGYQIAHLLTKTDVFKCAEAGAPVVNMTSAYGGIRWQSGMSRMFQYEQTQSRLGATLWEKPELYLENSPLFNLDKVSTPVLILHNDKDGAVPWYQGIEYFMGLRRLGKPAWLLNYNDEPHWPVKRQNRMDFNKRLEQFFDHYLMDKAMPKWMDTGIPAIEKGINDGFELNK